MEYFPYLILTSSLLTKDKYPTLAFGSVILGAGWILYSFSQKFAAQKSSTITAGVRG